MPTNLFSRKTLPYVALAVVLVGAALYYLWGRPASTDVITEDALPQSASEAVFLGLAGELDTVTFDGAIFTDPRFLSLKDIHTNVVEEPVGRRDPFASLPGITAQ